MLKTKFKNYDELYNTAYGYIYQFDRYVDYLKLTIDEQDNPIILNTITGEIIKGLRNINKYLELKELVVEV